MTTLPKKPGMPAAMSAGVASGSGGMPMPGTIQSAAPGAQMSMPTPSMKSSSSGDGMPRPGSMAAAGPGEMPGPIMASGAMPAPPGGSMPSRSSTSNGPPNGGGALNGSTREPGVVEVQFREGVAPTIAAGAGAPVAFTTAAKATSLDRFNEIARQHGMLSAEPSIDIDMAEATAAQAVARSQGVDVPHYANLVTLHFPNDADTVAIAAELRRLPEVERAIAVPRAIPPSMVPVTETRAPTPRREAAPPTDPLADPLVGSSDQVVLDPTTNLENQWYVFRCNADDAWPQVSGKDVVIADIDWGYRTTHQDLAPNIDKTYNSFDGGTDVTTGNRVFHGTGVTGLAAASANGKGIAGFAHEARIWAVQANTGPGSSLGGNAWARAIDWVRTTSSNGKRKVIILEVQTGAFGNYEQVPSVGAAIKTAIAGGVVVCVAAGNGDRDAGVDDTGQAFPETGSILVGATAYHATQNNRAWFSNFGPRIVVAAPGDPAHDLTTSNSSDTGYTNGFGGTSGATPKVAGAAALLLEANPALTHSEIRAILKTTGSAVNTAAGKPVGTLLDAGAALRRAKIGAVGRLEAFVRGADQAVWHRSQVVPNGGWNGWSSLGGWIDLLATSRNADGRLEIFARGSDKAVWHNWQTTPNGPWSGWSTLGWWVDRLAVGQNSDGRLQVFARGSDKALYHNWQTTPNGAWSGWSALGGWLDRLAVGRNADGRLEVFTRGSDGAVRHNWQVVPSGPWSGWHSLGGWVDMLEVGSNLDGRLELFARGEDGALYHNYQTTPNGGWSGWSTLGGRIDRLSVGRNADGRLEVFARGTDNAVWHNWQVVPNGDWSGWHSLGGWVDSIDVSQNQDGRLEVFARGADKALWHIWQVARNRNWSNWSSLEGWVDLVDIGQNAP
ncbi:MAG: S8 family serine peptidase [Polyangiaceae bacterium]|nr:S8 family serine peptidase [Polyangiaceae bacterium]